ncbi:MAG: nitroreductase family protein [Treponema sp.]|nr:nitroreductase family protein [Treponema sp.]
MLYGNRHSIRKFKSDVVPFDSIKTVLEAARLAPSAKNRQPWKFLVFANDKKDELISCMEKGIEREKNGNSLFKSFSYGIPDAENTIRVMKEAPVIIVVLNTNGKSPFIPVDSDGRIIEICDSLSIGAALENLSLAALEEGLGTLWIGNTCFAYKELIEYLSTDDQLVGAVALGFPNENPVMRPRKSLENIVEYRM